MTEMKIIGIDENNQSSDHVNSAQDMSTNWDLIPILVNQGIGGSDGTMFFRHVWLTKHAYCILRHDAKAT